MTTNTISKTFILSPIEITENWTYELKEI